MVIDRDTYKHDLGKKIKKIFKILLPISVIVFNILKLLAIRQVKKGKNMIRESCSTR